MVKKLFLILIFSISLLSTPTWAKVEATVSNTQIAAQQTFQLTIDVDNQSDLNQLDLSPLQNQFQILGRSTQSSYSNINGRISNKISLVVTLLPLVDGDVTIPSIKVGHQATDPIKVHISKLSDLPQSSQQQDVILKAEVDQKQTFVQQQVVYTLKLYVGTQISSANLVPPSITSGDAMFEPMGKGSKHEEVIKGKKYVVYRYQYALTPQKSGDVKISPAIFKGQKADPRYRRPFDSMFDDFFQNPLMGAPGKPVTLASKPMTIHVKPIPDKFNGSNWLPAISLHIFDEWDKKSQPYKVGEPITRTITLNAEGLGTNQLPELKLPDVAGVKQYASKGERNSENLDGNKLSSITTKVTIIPTQGGKITLPKIEIPWWNIHKDRQEVATLNAVTIDVTGGEKASGDSTNESKAAVTEDNDSNDKKIQHQPSESKQKIDITKKVQPQTKSLWESYGLYLMSGMLLLLLIVVLVLSFRQRKSLKQASGQNQSGNDFDKAAKTVKEIQFLKMNENRVLDMSPHEVREQLIAWAEQHWPSIRPMTINKIADLTNKNIANELEKLNKILYGDASLQWNAVDLLAHIKSFLQGQDKKSSRDGDLEPLFKTEDDK